MADVIANQSYADIGSITNSQLQVLIHSYDIPTALFLKRGIIDGYVKYSEQMMVQCGYSKNARKSPIVLEDPIYGSFDNKERDTYLSAILLL